MKLFDRRGEEVHFRGEQIYYKRYTNDNLPPNNLVQVYKVEETEEGLVSEMIYMGWDKKKMMLKNYKEKI
jgi:hypothetical protein